MLRSRRLRMDELRRKALTHAGYVVFPGLVPAGLVSAANAAITRDLALRYDPRRQVEYDNRSYCPRLRGRPPIMQLLTSPPVADLIEEVFGWENVAHCKGQIAIRRAHSAERREKAEPHIDGIATPHNGVRSKSISNFTALVGVYLTKTPRTYAGNFTVWPGSHQVLERWFRQRGKRAMREGMPRAEIGRPRQLRHDVGHVVLAHYQLAHTAAVNTSDVDRRAVYFRVWLRDVGKRRWELLTNIWRGWRTHADGEA